MRIRIKFFGQVAEIVGNPFIEMKLEKGRTLSEMKLQLENTYQGLQSVNYSIAVNKKMTHADCNLHEKDELAVLSPFSGG